MFEHSSVSVIIPALNEEQAIALVLRSVPDWVDEVIVVDNGSTDRTAAIAARCGARVVREPRRGYGAACQAGIAALGNNDIVVFVDADGSDDPRQMDRLVAPIARGEADFVIGSRTLGRSERRSITLQQRFGNALACFLMRALWSTHYTDLGPFRAIRKSAFQRLAMDDLSYGWTIQMQIRAARCALNVLEAPVDYRRRIGRSKISGTLRGTVAAGIKIMATIFRERFRSSRDVGSEAQDLRLLVFTRYPEPGRVKTRLIPTLGARGAADLQRRMTEHTLTEADKLQQNHPLAVEVRFSGGTQRLMQTAFGTGRTYRSQGDGDLGARMNRAFCNAFAEGATLVIAVGCDCPALDAATLRAAFRALRSHDVVLGPATDGGYYLIGLRRPCPALFNDISWGTSSVLSRTVEKVRTLNLSCHMLAPLVDVDRPSDLSALEPLAVTLPARARLSVIIPTLNEERCIEETLQSVTGCHNTEVIVVDGGSVDGTGEIAKRRAAIVLTSPCGRARQMNAGAAVATGEYLLFLHADTRPPREFPTHVREILSRRTVSAGAFRLSLDAPGYRFRLVEYMVNLRSRWFQMPYGDQGLFLRAETFRRLGGFPDLPVMEDYVFVRRLKGVGRIQIAPESAVTSARRWISHGVWHTTLLNQACLLAYHMGLSIARIARWRRPDSPHATSAPHASLGDATV